MILGFDIFNMYPKLLEKIIVIVIYVYFRLQGQLNYKLMLYSV